MRRFLPSLLFPLCLALPVWAWASPPPPGMEAVPLPPSALPALEAPFTATLSALLEGRWAVAGAAGLVLVLLVLRKVGGAFFPALATDVGGAALAAGAGATLTVLELLQQQSDPTLALVLVAAASGFWAWAKKLGLVGLVLRALGKAPPAEPPPAPAPLE